MKKENKLINLNIYMLHQKSRKICAKKCTVMNLIKNYKISYFDCFGVKREFFSNFYFERTRESNIR